MKDGGRWWQSRRTLGTFCPINTQLDNNQIILTTPEKDMKTDRTNFTTKGREKAT